MLKNLLHGGMFDHAISSWLGRKTDRDPEGLELATLLSLGFIPGEGLG